MGNIGITIKRFLSNKNTVTIIGVMLGIVVLYIGYNYRVKHAVETVLIPYATKTITATTAITSDDVKTMEVLKSMVVSNKQIVANLSEVISSVNEMCASERTTIPEGSFFYKEQVKPCNSVAGNSLKGMPDGYKAVGISVDLLKTYGNSMNPGDYIDIYIKTKDEDGRLIYNVLITKLQILDVRDSNGESIVYGNSATNIPAILLFAVPNFDKDGTNLFLLLSKASMLQNIELIPIPGNASYTAEVGETVISSEYLKQKILDQTAIIPDEAVREVS